MKTEIRRAEDRTILVCVRLRLESPHGNDGPEVETIFSAHWPEDFTRSTTVIGLLHLSTTRMDTRTPIDLAPTTFQNVVDVAALAADDYEKELLGGG